LHDPGLDYGPLSRDHASFSSEHSRAKVKDEPFAVDAWLDDF
jgi:hypothetical protein